jgi:transposase
MTLAHLTALAELAALADQVEAHAKTDLVLLPRDCASLAAALREHVTILVDYVRASDARIRRLERLVDSMVRDAVEADCEEVLVGFSTHATVGRGPK